MTENLQERYRATLIGTTVGDTLGMPLELWSRDRIQKYIGRVTEPLDPWEIIPKDNEGQPIDEDEFGKFFKFTRFFKKGQYTDDTILTLALAESIVEVGGLDLDNIAKKHLEAYYEHINSGGFGRTTIDAMKRLAEGYSPMESAINPGAGNGPAMKMSPMGLYLHASRDNSTRSFAENIGKMAHLDPRSVVSGVIQTMAIFYLLHDVSKEDLFFNIRLTASNWEQPIVNRDSANGDLSLLEKIAWVNLNRDLSSENAYQHLGNSGFVNESYPFALFMFQKYFDDPVEGLIETVNFGGDADTVGAIFGSLAGARHGMFMPESWLEVLQGKERLIAAADGIFALRKE